MKTEREREGEEKTTTPRSILTLAFSAAKSNRNKSDTFKCAGPGPGPVCVYRVCYSYIYTAETMCSRGMRSARWRPQPCPRQGSQLEGREGGGGSRPASRGNFATPVIAAIILVSLSCLQIYYHDQLPLRSAPPLPHFPLLPPACLD